MPLTFVMFSHELCKGVGLPGKPTGISGADVDRYSKVAFEKLPNIARAMFLNTYRVLVAYELFPGGLSYEVSG